MSTYYFCPYLSASVELTTEREQHISERHPDLLPEYKSLIGETLADPDMVRGSVRFVNAKLFTRWFDTVRDGKHIIVVVVSNEADDPRHWVITAYMARKLSEGDIEWQRG